MTIFLRHFKINKTDVIVMTFNVNNVNNNFFLISKIFNFVLFKIFLHIFIHIYIYYFDILLAVLPSWRFLKMDILPYMFVTKKICFQLEEGKYPVVLPLQLRKKQCTDSKMPQYTVISEKNEYDENDDGINVSGSIIYYSISIINCMIHHRICVVNCIIYYRS